MRRRGFLILLAAVVAIAVGSAYALNVNSGQPVVFCPTGATYVVVDSFADASHLPDGYTINPYASEVVYVSRWIGDAWETPWKLKADQSILLPSPQPVYNPTSGTYRHFIRCGAHTDTVAFLPWKQ